MCANPQVENGHTDIANELMEEFAKTRIPGEARQVLDFILRKTYGWHKKEDAISLSQFMEGTNLKKQPIVRSLYKLLQMHLIIKQKKNKVTYYSFNKDYDQWKPLSKKMMTFLRVSSLIPICYACGYDTVTVRHHIIPQAEGGPNKVGNIVILCPNCHALAHKGVIQQETLIIKKDNVEKGIKKDNVKETESKMLPTKETIQKKLLQKKTTLAEPSGSLPIDKEIIKKPNPDIKIFIDWYSDWFLSVFDEKPLIEGGKDGTIVRRLLGTYGLEKLKGLAEAFFESDDEFIQKTGYTIGVFSKVINKLLINKRGLSKKVPKGWQAIKNYLEEAEREKPDLCEGDGITE